MTEVSQNKKRPWSQSILIYNTACVVGDEFCTEWQYEINSFEVINLNNSCIRSPNLLNIAHA